MASSFSKFYRQVFLQVVFDNLFWRDFLVRLFATLATARPIYGKVNRRRPIGHGWTGHPRGERLMYFVAAVLAVLAGLFYAAGNNELGSWGATMCQYGNTFCDHPVYVLAGAILAAIWAGFVSIR
jgi:hypothetical protein